MRINSKTCLIIEDQKPSLEFMTEIVKSAFPDLSIEAAGNLKAARKWIENRTQSPAREPISLVLVDLGLPDGNGVDVIHFLMEREPDAIPIVMTFYDDDAFLFPALMAGAKGYLLKGDDPVLLTETLKRIERSDPPLSPAIARKLLNHFNKPALKEESSVKLSPREHETLILLSRGLTVPEVAAHLNLSALTISGYVKIIYQKLHVSNRVELMLEANRRNLI